MNFDVEHVMIDIETLGTQPNSVIVSIGAVKFDFESGQTYEEFYTPISLESCVEWGMNIDVNTLLWWFSQSEESKKVFFEKSLPIPQALSDLADFIPSDCVIWANSPSFDITILESAYRTIGYQTMPWSHRNIMDVRTVVALNPDIKKSFVYEGAAHNALADCYNQIKYLRATYFDIFKNNI